MSHFAAAHALRDMIIKACDQARKDAAPFAPSHAQYAKALQPIVHNILDLDRDFVQLMFRAYPGQIAGTWAAHVLAEVKSAWSLEA
jgi:hypothetical protein